MVRVRLTKKPEESDYAVKIFGFIWQFLSWWVRNIFNLLCVMLIANYFLSIIIHKLGIDQLFIGGSSTLDHLFAMIIMLGIFVLIIPVVYMILNIIYFFIKVSFKGIGSTFREIGLIKVANFVDTICDFWF